MYTALISFLTEYNKPEKGERGATGMGDVV